MILYFFTSFHPNHPLFTPHIKLIKKPHTKRPLLYVLSHQPYYSIILLMKKEGQKTNNLVIHPQKSMSYVFNLRYYSKSGWCPFYVALQEIRFFFLFLITLNTHFFFVRPLKSYYVGNGMVGWMGLWLGGIRQNVLIGWILSIIIFI